MDNNYHVVKYIVVGHGGVGKSSLTQYYVNSTLASDVNTSTIGVEFYTKKVDINGTTLKLHIWDTAGQERFRSIVRGYYRDAIGCFICFSVANKETFDNLDRFFTDVTEYCKPHISVVLVGTFSDIINSKREVTREMAEELATKYNIDYYEVSSKTGSGITDCFNALTEKVYSKIEICTEDKSSISLEYYEKNDCCR